MAASQSRRRARRRRRARHRRRARFTGEFSHHRHLAVATRITREISLTSEHPGLRPAMSGGRRVPRTSTMPTTSTTSMMMAMMMMMMMIMIRMKRTPSSYTDHNHCTISRTHSARRLTLCSATEPRWWVSLGRELAYAVVPPASEEPCRGVNRLTAKARFFGNGASASIASVVRFTYVISEHFEAGSL